MNESLPAYAEKPRSVGRPRAFDIDLALDKALLVFTERGYHAASISDLSEAMGLTPGSVYKAFGDKRGIFLAAFDRYVGMRRHRRDQAIADAVNGYEKIRRLLTFFAEMAHGEHGRIGCLVVGAASDLALFDEDAARQIAASFAYDEAQLIDLVRLGQQDGSISATAAPADIALTLLCLTKGMRVVGKTGRSRQDMVAVTETALKLLT